MRKLIYCDKEIEVSDEKTKIQGKDTLEILHGERDDTYL